MQPGTKTVSYKKSRFATSLPADYLYTPSHFWAAPSGPNLWRIGFTKFATRMLGEMVDYGFDVQENAPVELGQIIGWIEGFKAISDLFCVGAGHFTGVNALLKEKITAINKDPYHTGWIYSLEGTLDSKCVGVHDYIKILDRAIDRILEKEKEQEI